MKYILFSQVFSEYNNNPSFEGLVHIYGLFMLLNHIKVTIIAIIEMSIKHDSFNNVEDIFSIATTVKNCIQKYIAKKQTAHAIFLNIFILL